MTTLDDMLMQLQNPAPDDVDPELDNEDSEFNLSFTFSFIH
jgi:hypothetical protein